MKAMLLDSADATAALGAAVANALGNRAGGVVYLEGPLGAGKTTLARGLLRALGVSGAIRSPTYTLLEPYEIAQLPAPDLRVQLAHEAAGRRATISGPLAAKLD
jgi:tRNA threonylcarbamoyl adenosine modification protein YjeE